MNTTFLTALLSTPSPTGFESPGQKLWIKEVKKYADSVQTDSYGNAWATVRGKSKKVLLLESHADEIGFMVKYVSKEGFISIDRIGGSDAAVARARRLTIYGDKGPVVGVIGCTAIHLREDREKEKVPKVHELTVDVGAKNEKEVKALGIRVGHPAVYVDTVSPVGKHCLAGRAIDNRLGGFILIEVLKALAKGKKPAWTVVALNAVQEEIGGYGAKMATHRVRPDAAIVFDVTHSTDSPGIKKEQHGAVEMQSGPTVTHGSCNHPGMVAYIESVAKKKKIPLQHEAASRYSGSDASVVFHSRDGVPTALVSLPVRYMHTVVEMVDQRDIRRTIALLTGCALGSIPVE